MSIDAVFTVLFVLWAASLFALGYLVDRSSFAAGVEVGRAREAQRHAQDAVRRARTVRPLAGCSVTPDITEFEALLDADIRRTTRDPIPLDAYRRPYRPGRAL